jgi:hypothetical protein
MRFGYSFFVSSKSFMALHALLEALHSETGGTDEVVEFVDGARPLGVRKKSKLRKSQLRPDQHSISAYLLRSSQRLVCNHTRDWGAHNKP